MTVADDEINQHMDELSDHYDRHLSVIETVSGNFGDAIVDERLEIDGGETGKREISLGQTMADLEQLVQTRRARLGELALEYARVRQRLGILAVMIFGEVHGCFAGPLKGQGNQTVEGTCSVVGVDADVGTAPKRSTALEQLDEMAESGLHELRNRLDDLVLRGFEENMGALKVTSQLLRIL